MNRLYDLSAKELSKQSGIYMITCNEHKYIGSSKSLYKRLRDHRHYMINGVHSNDFMQRAFDKYGLDSFYYKVLELCSPEVRIERENYYIDTLKPDFNLQLDPVSKTLSVYSRQKLSKSIIAGRKLGKYVQKVSAGPVDMYDHFGKYLCSFDNVDIAASKTGIDKDVIVRACRGYRRGRMASAVRFRYQLGKVPAQEFTFNNVSSLSRQYTMTFVTDNGKRIKCNTIKDINSAFVQLIVDRNWTSTVELEPKCKVPLKLRELLEHLETGNQQPRPDSNAGKVQRLREVTQPSGVEGETRTSAETQPMITRS